MERNENRMDIILASKSPRRRALLEQMGVRDFRIVTPDIDEHMDRDLPPAELVRQISLEKAQAVAARTYTYSKMERDTAGHPEADLCTDVNCCQAYRTREDAAASWGTNAQMYTDKIAAAVADTDGVAVLYEGSPIQAVFFSSADGRTVDAVEVWGNSVPYLTGVDSPEGEEVPNYHSNVTLTAEEFKTKLLAKYPGADLSGDPSGWFSHTVSNSAGGVSSVDVGGVTVSGGEPLTQPEALAEFLSLCKQHGLHTAAETCGAFTPAALETCAPYLDLFLFDLKSADSARLAEVTGADLARVTANLRRAVELGREVVVRVPVIPGFNHDEAGMKGIFALALDCGAKRLDLLPYHTLGKNKYAALGRDYPLGDTPMLTKGEVEPWRQLACSMGLDARVGG